MKHLLPLFSRPSHYLGTETNSVHKDLDQVQVHVALAFPDLYEVAMSYLGQKILYASINGHEQFYAERSFAPTLDVAEILRAHNTALATLESDTPLWALDAVLFSLTHELCYTNVLYMLELGQIPRHSQARNAQHPLVIAGGGCTFNAEPLAPFVDVMVLGDGEEVVPQILTVLAQAKVMGLERPDLFKELAALPGVYIPSFFSPARSDHDPGETFFKNPEKRIVLDMNQVSFPTQQVVPFGKPVHDRYSVEIARGCTRGCRFCQAGIIYRPVRERSVPNLSEIINQGLAETGSEELSFLSLSTGDFSALEDLFLSSYSRCCAEQISISLPSLRVGSVSRELMLLLSTLRRTGLTLAPEAGTQRLRDVINKGISEAQLLEHTRIAFELGWQQVKLYFMIGLPTEERQDLDGILDLCLKVAQSAGQEVKRLQVTAAISPFVPKPHTPFQWEAQISMEEIEERIAYLRSIFKAHRRLKLRWHHSHMTFLEGVFSRGDRALAPAVEHAYEQGAVFTSWSDHLNLDLWLQAFAQTKIDPEKYLQSRDLDAPLPWDHLNCGVSRQFLLTERSRALAGRITEDCRHGLCRNCGLCNFNGRQSLLTAQSQGQIISPVLNASQVAEDNKQPLIIAQEDRPDMHQRHGRFRLWYSKTGPAIYLSQLELQRIFERAFRRLHLPLAFSSGFRPAPLLSFARALPVGVGSECEWMDFFVYQDWEQEKFSKHMAKELPQGLAVTALDQIPVPGRSPQAFAERFVLEFIHGADHEKFKEKLEVFLHADTWPVSKLSKRGQTTTLDLRAMVTQVALEREKIIIDFNWRDIYVSPVFVLQGIDEQFSLVQARLLKTRQEL